MQDIRTPPNVSPIFRNGRYEADPIPGMVQMVPGIPFVYFIDGDENRAMTIACGHTLKSLAYFQDFNDIVDAAVRLAKLTWGCKAHNGSPHILRLCRLPGLKRNERSSGLDPNVIQNTRDGSYSLACTVMQGNGQGIVVPAEQVNTVEASEQIATVLQTLHTLYRLLIPKCVSKMEFELSDFHNQLNNVFGFGGLEPNGTSCQFNCSSSLEGELRAHIGMQGGWHTDCLDDPAMYTLFTLLIHVGPCKYDDCLS
jgi:hypothetical protein